MFRKIFPNKKWDFVDLTIGRVYLKPLTNIVYNKALAKSTVANGIIANGVFLLYIEKALTCLPFWKYNNLPLKDGDKLRTKLKQILLELHVLKEEQKELESPQQFNPKDVEWFNEQSNKVKAHGR